MPGNRNFKGYFWGIVEVAEMAWDVDHCKGGTKMRGTACRESLADSCAAVVHEPSRRQRARTVGLPGATGFWTPDVRDDLNQRQLDHWESDHPGEQTCLQGPAHLYLCVLCAFAVNPNPLDAFAKGNKVRGRASWSFVPAQSTGTSSRVKVVNEALKISNIFG
jgi:hypothetical protein